MKGWRNEGWYREFSGLFCDVETVPDKTFTSYHIHPVPDSKWKELDFWLLGVQRISVSWAYVMLDGLVLAWFKSCISKNSSVTE